MGGFFMEKKIILNHVQGYHCQFIFFSILIHIVT